jgi:hypothetical protein
MGGHDSKRTQSDKSRKQTTGEGTEQNARNHYHNKPYPTKPPFFSIEKISIAFHCKETHRITHVAISPINRIHTMEIKYEGSIFSSASKDIVELAAGKVVRDLSVSGREGNCSLLASR